MAELFHAGLAALLRPHRSATGTAPRLPRAASVSVSRPPGMWGLIAGLAVGAGCGGPTEAPLIAALDVVSGNGQLAAPGTALPQPLVLRVAASTGSGIPGETVEFHVTGGSGVVAPASAVSNSQGLVSVTWTLGPVVGTQTIEARATGATVTGSPVAVTLGASSDRPTITIVSGDGQIATVGTQLPQPIVLQLKSSSGTPLVSYTFTLRSLTCSLSNGLECSGEPADDQVASPTLTTGADGSATFTGWTLGTTVNVKCLGLYPGTSVPQNASDVGLGPFPCATAEPGPPARLVKRSQDQQQGPAGTTLLSIGVIVEDQFLNPVGCWEQTTACFDPNAPEVQVTFAASAGGTVSPSQATTERGTAVTDWTIATGPNTLTISVGNLSITYSATGT